MSRVCKDCGLEVLPEDFLSPGWQLCARCYSDEVNAGEVYEDRRDDEDDEREEDDEA